jgi:hypothetical protein
MGGLTWLAATDDAVPGSTSSARVCWLVRLSLAQTGKWLFDRGAVPQAALKDVPTEIPQADIDRWSIESDTPVGAAAPSRADRALIRDAVPLGPPLSSPRP